MDWQQLVSLAIVGTAAVLLFRGRWRRRKFSFERDTHCGCGSGSQAPRMSVVFHARKGAQPQVIVKMK